MVQQHVSREMGHHSWFVWLAPGRIIDAHKSKYNCCMSSLSAPVLGFLAWHYQTEYCILHRKGKHRHCSLTIFRNQTSIDHQRALSFPEQRHRKWRLCWVLAVSTSNYFFGSNGKRASTFNKKWLSHQTASVPIKSNLMQTSIVTNSRLLRYTDDLKHS